MTLQCRPYCTVRFAVMECDKGPDAAVMVKEERCGVRVTPPHPVNPTARAAPTRASTANLFQR